MSRLEAFVRAARQRVRNGGYSVGDGPLPAHGPFSAALHAATPADARDTASPAAALVAELKPASPSAGPLLSRPAREVVDAYRRGGADAISVLTDADFFGGSLGLLRQAHGAGLPTLMKDFVVDEAQLAAAAHCGASAVLLIERVLDRPQRDRLIAAAHDHGLEVLLEVFDAAEADAAAASEADVLGVNARDLETLRVDVDAQQQVLRRLADDPRPTLALSGIARRADLLDAQAAGASGVLVGMSLMRQRDPALALRALRRPLAKVCGITDDGALHAAAAAGADLIGLVVLSPQSPRDLDMDAAQALAGAVRTVRGGEGDPTQPGVVLVTSSPDADAVVAAAARVRPDFVQWHGAPGDAAGRLHGLGVGLLAGVAGHPPPAQADGFVADSGVVGGTGRTHDWRQTRRLCDLLPWTLSLVAGGLAADNATEAVAATRAWGADASSRLESGPGRKDPAAVAAFVQAVHAGT